MNFIYRKNNIIYIPNNEDNKNNDINQTYIISSFIANSEPKNEDELKQCKMTAYHWYNTNYLHINE